MELEGFKIYVDRLRDGAIEKISEVFTSDFLCQRDESLSYQTDVNVVGEAYLAENDLILHLNVSTSAEVPCTICTKPVTVPVTLEGLYIVEPLEEIPSGIYSFREALRESIILEAPRFAKCGGEKCENEAEYTKYLKQKSVKESRSLSSNEEGHQPFKDLDLN